MNHFVVYMPVGSGKPDMQETDETKGNRSFSHKEAVIALAGD
jgi:hypothetical protein